MPFNYLELSILLLLVCAFAGGCTFIEELLYGYDELERWAVRKVTAIRNRRPPDYLA